MDQLSCTLRRLCSVFGTGFTVHVGKVLFKTTLGLGFSSSAGAISPHDDDPTRNQRLVKKVIFDTGDAVVRSGGRGTGSDVGCGGIVGPPPQRVCVCVCVCQTCSKTLWSGTPACPRWSGWS